MTFSDKNLKFKIYFKTKIQGFMFHVKQGPIIQLTLLVEVVNPLVPGVH